MMQLIYKLNGPSDNGDVKCQVHEHRLKAMSNGQWSKFLRLKSQFGVLRGAEMKTGKKHSFYHIVNDGKSSGNETEDVTLLLETMKYPLLLSE